MRVFIQDDDGNLLATMVNGQIFGQGGEGSSFNKDMVALALFKTAFQLMSVVPNYAVTNDIQTRDAEGGTP